MGIVTGHAVEFLLALLVTAAPGQRGSLKPDRVGRARLENDTKLRLAMAFRHRPTIAGPDAWEGRAMAKSASRSGRDAWML